MLKIGTQICLRSLAVGVSKPSVINTITNVGILLNSQPVRNTSFFNKLTQEQLWKGVVSVSSAGRRKGRGRNADRRLKRNPNSGHRIGDGKIRVLWPGLNYQILGNSGISKIKQLPKSETPPPAANASPRLLKKFKKVHPLERGWSGRQTRGKKIDPPASTESENFENFQSIVIDLKMVTQMTATLGRQRVFRALVVTGNGNGLVGVGKASRIDYKSSLNLANSRAAKRLLTIDLIDKHTVNHDFFSEYGRTKITVLKKPKGHGLRCHRIIIALCRVIGIEDLYAKVKGRTNPKNIVKAFIIGLLRQKTYQDIADENKLHLVEFREEKLNFPELLASPEKCRTPAEARRELTLFDEYIMGGKLRYDGGSKVPFYAKLPSWTTHLRRTLYTRNHDKMRLNLFMKYGSCVSHLTKAYPECRSNPPSEKKEDVET